jgi:hydrogenase maturation protease
MTESEAPVLVLGLGNLLLRDDGLGLELLRQLRQRYPDKGAVDFVDGGTQGVALLSYLASRRALLILDAVSTDADPGTALLLRNPLRHASPRGFGAHGANASGLLASAELLGELPEQSVLVGMVPAELQTGVGLSEQVQRGLPQALELAEGVLDELLDRPREGEGAFTS